MSYNFKIVNFSDPDKLERLEKYLESNGEPGHPSPFKILNEHYTHKKNGVTDWTGFPSSGKTYFVLEYLLGLSERFNLRHGLYLPDLGNYYEVMEKLVKMHTGKDFHNNWNNKITLKELYAARAWIDNYFKIIVRSEVKKDVHPEMFWEFICDYKDEMGGLQTGVIDAWKNISKEGDDKNRDLYLDRVLSYRNELSEQENKHFHTIAHPTKTELDQAKGQGKRRVPNANDIKGGGAWYANGKNIITIDRPEVTLSNVDVYVWKTKPENVGKAGSILENFMLDLRKGRYYERWQGNRMYAWEYEGKILSENLTRNEQIEETKKAVEAMKEAKEFIFKDVFGKEDDEPKNGLF